MKKTTFSLNKFHILSLYKNFIESSVLLLVVIFILTTICFSSFPWNISKNNLFFVFLTLFPIIITQCFKGYYIYLYYKKFFIIHGKTKTSLVDFDLRNENPAIVQSALSDYKHIFYLMFIVSSLFICLFLYKENSTSEINTNFWLFLVWPSFIYYTTKSNNFGRFQALIYFLDSIGYVKIRDNKITNEEVINISLNASRLDKSDCKHLLNSVLPMNNNIMLYSDNEFKMSNKYNE